MNSVEKKDLKVLRRTLASVLEKRAIKARINANFALKDGQMQLDWIA